MFVTGDVAEAGLPEEFEAGRSFLTALAGELGLLPQKFVFVPGNHDINWDACQEAFFRARKEGRTSEAELRAALDEAKFEFYDSFVRNFYDANDPREPLTKGAFLYRFGDLRLAVAALNSCEKESHRKGDHVGALGRDQAESAMSALRRDEMAGWLKVLATHHNPDRATRNNLESWRAFLLKKGTVDEDLLARYESDALGLEGRERLVAITADAKAHLLLHGHQHASDKLTWDWSEDKGHTHVFSSGSLSLQADVLPRDEPASARLLILDPDKEEIRADRLVYLSWHRVEGEVEWGGFTPDPSSRVVVRLDLPRGFKQDLAPLVVAQGKPVDSEFLQAFRQRFGDQYAPWDLGSLGVVRLGGIHEATESRLDDMYLELRFDAKLDQRKADQESPLLVEDLLSRSRPLVLTGVEGAGKTTWARYTFRRLVRDERALPLMLVLRDLARYWQWLGGKGVERSIDAALDAWVGAQMGSGWTGRLSEILKAASGPRPILLVDGWDELGPLGEEFRDKLVGFLREHPRVLAVVTSRPYGEQKPTHADGFEKLEVQPLSDGDIEQMTKRFFGRFSGEEIATRQVEQFLSALDRAEEARALARTPLLLTMMLLVGYSEPLPDKRHLLYAKCIDTLLHARPEQKGGGGALAGRHTFCPPGLDTRRRWVAALAFGAQTAGYETNAASRKARAPIVSSWKELVSLLPEDCSAEQREGFLAWLVEVAGLLVERSDGSLLFTHLSFQEYLSALHLSSNAWDAEQRLNAVRDRISKSFWWETLRLFAAQVDGSNPETLEVMLRSLLDDPASGPRAQSFLGTILADGLGSSALFGEWSQKFLQLLSSGWPEGADTCASSWLATRQHGRRDFLGRSLSIHAADQSWLGWLRCEEFGRGWASAMKAPGRSTARGLVEALRYDNDLSRESVAAGRLLVGAFPLWPAERDFGYLHLWPGARRLAGLRLQATAAAGIPLSALNVSAKGTLAPKTKDNISRARGGRDLANFFARILARELDFDLALSWARDWARYIARNWDRSLARRVANIWVQDTVRDWAIDGTHNLNRNYAHGLARDWARKLARDLARDQASDWASAETDYPADSRACLKDFGLIEVNSWGRTSVRGLIAWLGEQTTPLRSLLAEASRASLRPPRRSLKLTTANLDPLWPALARHIARGSTEEDRDLLETAARTGGEGYPEPLCWGLQFIVRGDVMLDDGSVVTLDELADEAGVPRLPYLEDMEPELEVDWEADEEEPAAVR